MADIHPVSSVSSVSTSVPVDKDLITPPVVTPVVEAAVPSPFEINANTFQQATEIQIDMQRTLRFRVEGQRVVIEVRNAEGDVLRVIPPSELEQFRNVPGFPTSALVVDTFG